MLRYDADDEGELDLEELRELVRAELLLPAAALSEAQLRELWDHFDASGDGDGAVSCAEFVAFVLAPHPDDAEDARVCALLNERARRAELVDDVVRRMNAQLRVQARRRAAEATSSRAVCVMCRSPRSRRVARLRVARVPTVVANGLDEVSPTCLSAVVAHKKCVEHTRLLVCPRRTRSSCATARPT